MAGKRKRANGWEYVIKRAGVLERPLYLSFDDEAVGDAYVARVEAMLDKGILPPEAVAQQRLANIEELVRAYLRDAHPSRKDQQQLETVVKGWGDTPLAAITAEWVDAWVSVLKREHHLAPGTIQAKVGALARCTDWGMRKGLLLMPDHPLRTLPVGYASYTKTDTALAGVEVKDVERDRRLEPGELERILAVIDGGVLARKLRPLALPHPRAMRCLLLLALESAMRLREQYTLRVDQVDLPRRTVFLDKTKNGDRRQVPLSSVAVAELTAYLAERPAVQPELLFPWWDGDESPKALATLSDYLSKLFRGVFEQAKCPGLHFHDLRHEATSRLFERTTLSEAQIMKITGHKSHRMMMRYANLRGSDLAARLW